MLAKPLSYFVRISTPFGQLGRIVSMVIDNTRVGAPLLKKPHNFKVARISCFQEGSHATLVGVGEACSSVQNLQQDLPDKWLPQDVVSQARTPITLRGATLQKRPATKAHKLTQTAGSGAGKGTGMGVCEFGVRAWLGYEGGSQSDLGGAGSRSLDERCVSSPVWLVHLHFCILQQVLHHIELAKASRSDKRRIPSLPVGA